MKKITFLLLLTLSIMVGCNTKTNAQASLLYTNTDSTSSGTIATTGTGTSRVLYDANTIYTFYTKGSGIINDRNPNYLFTWNVTKGSGSGTAKVFIQGSHDGKVWENINAGMLGTDGKNSDTLNIAAATTTPGVNYAYSSQAGVGVLRASSSSAVYYVNSRRYFYFRFKIVGAGTQETTYSNGKVYTFN